jgi:transposase InsO family protein
LQITGSYEIFYSLREAQVFYSLREAQVFYSLREAQVFYSLREAQVFYSLREAQVVIESWRRHYNQVRPHASLGYRAPAPEVVLPALATRMTVPPQPAAPTTPVMAPRPVMH